MHPERWCHRACVAKMQSTFASGICWHTLFGMHSLYGHKPFIASGKVSAVQMQACQAAAGECGGKMAFTAGFPEGPSMRPVATTAASIAPAVGPNTPDEPEAGARAGTPTTAPVSGGIANPFFTAGVAAADAMPAEAVAAACGSPMSISTPWFEARLAAADATPAAAPAPAFGSPMSVQITSGGIPNPFFTAGVDAAGAAPSTGGSRPPPGEATTAAAGSAVGLEAAPAGRQQSEDLRDRPTAARRQRALDSALKSAAQDAGASRQRADTAADGQEEGPSPPQSVLKSAADNAAASHREPGIAADGQENGPPPQSVLKSAADNAAASHREPGIAADGQENGPPPQSVLKSAAENAAASHRESGNASEERSAAALPAWADAAVQIADAFVTASHCQCWPNGRPLRWRSPERLAAHLWLWGIGVAHIMPVEGESHSTDVTGRSACLALKLKFRFGLGRVSKRYQCCSVMQGLTRLRDLLSRIMPDEPATCCRVAPQEESRPRLRCGLGAGGAAAAQVAA